MVYKKTNNYFIQFKHINMKAKFIIHFVLLISDLSAQKNSNSPVELYQYFSIISYSNTKAIFI